VEFSKCLICKDLLGLAEGGMGPFRSSLDSKGTNFAKYSEQRSYESGPKALCLGLVVFYSHRTANVTNRADLASGHGHSGSALAPDDAPLVLRLANVQCCFRPGGSLKRWLDQFFELSEHQTTLRREIIAGLTTFFTMSYIVAVNPAILKTAGMPVGASLTATIVTAIFGTLLMGFFANRPFAIGPYMGENAFVAFTVVQVLGYTWQRALGAVLVAGVLFILMTLFRLRQWMVDAIPSTLRYS